MNIGATGNGVKVLRKLKSQRKKYLGTRPGKRYSTAEKVIARLRAEDKVRTDPATREVEFLAGDNKWYELKFSDMAHKEDAVVYWNRLGRQYEERSPEVRTSIKGKYHECTF